VSVLSTSLLASYRWIVVMYGINRSAVAVACCCGGLLLPKGKD
jgi:hypothetical protein